MADLIALLSGIEKKTHDLQKYVMELRQENQILATKTRDRDNIIENQKQKITDLENQNSILKIGGAVQTAGRASGKTKQRLNDLVREIDLCIELLDR